MALRFQEKDAVDEEVKEQRSDGVRASIAVYGFFFVLLALIFGLFDWFSAKSLKSYGEEIAWFLGFLWFISFADWLLSPIYNEFRFRTKEIDGKVSAIEKAVTASKEDQRELLEKLTAIEEKLESCRREWRT